MAVRTRVATIERTLVVLVDRRTDPEQQSRRLAAVARRALAEAQAQNAVVLGAVPAHETIVDGRPGASEDSVRPDGVIVHEFTTALRVDVLRFVAETLRGNAPELTGRFRDSIAIYADGAEVEEPEQAVDAEEVTFVATVAYARKLESGASPQAPNGVFEAAAVLARGRFGNQAAIKFTFAAPIGGDTHLERWAAGRAASKRRRGRYAERLAIKDRRNPAVLVRWL